MTVDLRPARDHDVPAVAQVWWEGWGDAHLGHVPEEVVVARTRESFDSRAASRVADISVIEVGGVVQGFVMVGEDEVEQVFLDRGARGSGLATLLLDEGERRVRSHGHRRARLFVVPGNARARAFYARRGWRDDGDVTYTPVDDDSLEVPCRLYTKHVSPLVSASELASLWGEVTVLDVRYRMGGPAGPEEYAAGHVPGASYIDLDTDLASSPGDGGRHPLPSSDVFLAAMRRAGVSSSRPVVVYDDWSGHAAARAWWLLRHHGHPAVHVLDGGWSAWRQSGGGVAPCDPDQPLVEGDFDGEPGSMPVVTADDVLDVDVLVDARAPERYRGETEPIDPVAGHIPGAVNVPTSTNLQADGTFRPPDQLAALYAAAGAPPGADVAAYCGSGVTACHDVLAMEVAGVRAALYPGSWSEWVGDSSRPVETG